MSLTFAGEPLLLPDPEGELQKWIDRYRPLESILNAPVATRSGRTREQGHWPHAVGLPVPNWEQFPPRWKLNSLWWPTGASRFAVGLFLVTADGAARIATTTGSNGSGTLTMTDGTRSLSTTMWALPALPIGSEDRTNPPMLLTLVDRRYWWQWSRSGEMFVGPLSTWEEIRTAITSGLGASITAPEPEDAYLAPDWSEFDRWHENTAMLLDGYAATVGQRFVASLDGSFALQKFGTADEGADGNLEHFFTAGGRAYTRTGEAPGNVAVVFQKRQGGIVHQNGVCEIVTKSAGDYGFNANAPGIATIHTTFQANFSSRGEEADNSTAMDELANQIAADFYGWKQRQYSVTIPGVAGGWTMTGFDDYAWFMFGTPHPGSDANDTRLCHTIVESFPPNFGVEENLAQEHGTESPKTLRPSPIHRAEITGEWEEGVSERPDHVTARLLYESSGAYPPPGQFSKDEYDIKIFDTLGIRGTLEAGDKVWVAALPADSEMFELVSSSAQPEGIVVFEILSQFAPTKHDVPISQGSARICVLNAGGIWQATGDLIVVIAGYSANGIGMWRGSMQGAALAIGARGLAFKRGDDKYEIIFMQMRDGLADFLVNPNAALPLVGEIPANIDYSYQHGSLGFEQNTIDVRDLNEIYPRALPEGRGVAGYDYVRDQYQALVCQQQGTTAIAFLAAPLKRTDFRATIKNFRIESFSPFNLTPDPPPTKPHNFLDFTGDTDDIVWLEWNETADNLDPNLQGDWQVIQVKQDDPIFRGKTTVAHDKGATKTVRRYTNFNGNDIDTGRDYEVINRGTNIAADKVVWFTKIGESYEIISVECPATP